jgi:excisionase family DNA binding protein
MATPELERRYISIAEAAAYMGCGINSVRRMINSGELHAYHFGSRRLTRVELTEVEALLTPIPAKLER